MANPNQLPELSSSDAMFLSELKSEVVRLYDRHTDKPRIFVPALLLEQIEQDISDGEYNPHDEIIAPEHLDALAVNLITEDGLPFYTSTLLNKSSKDHPFTDWVNLWTAEEGRHSPAIHAFLHRTGQMDMKWLEAQRMQANSHPDTPQPDSFIEGIVYTSIQEPATEISHRNTISQLPPGHRRVARRTISPVVGDEVKHGIFYGDLSAAAIEIDQSLVTIAIARQILGFRMPGLGMPGFAEKAQAIDKAGIFGPAQLLSIYDKLFEERWPIETFENLTPDAERARQLILRKHAQLGKLVARRANILERTDDLS